jgi:hypothetical protein
MAPPVSNNWGFTTIPEFDKLVAAVHGLRSSERDKAPFGPARAPADQAAFLWWRTTSAPCPDAKDQELGAAEELVRRLSTMTMN